MHQKLNFDNYFFTCNLILIKIYLNTLLEYLQEKTFLSFIFKMKKNLKYYVTYNKMPQNTIANPKRKNPVLVIYEIVTK